MKGASAAGIVAISVGKTPAKNEFFRTHRDIPADRADCRSSRWEWKSNSLPSRLTWSRALNGIGITVTDHVLYLTITTRGAIRIVPVRQANADGEQNEYNRTKEIGLIQGIDEWVRLFTDQENRCYKVFPAPAGRFGDPQWPDLKPAKIFKSGVPRQGPPHRQHRASAVQEVGGS